MQDSSGGSGNTGNTGNSGDLEKPRNASNSTNPGNASSSANSANRLDRLPISGFHKTTMVALAFAYFFEFADINTFAITAPKVRDRKSVV